MCYTEFCEPHRNGCESPAIGEYFVRHVPGGWQVLAVEDGDTPFWHGREVRPLPTREEAEALARWLASY